MIVFIPQNGQFGAKSVVRHLSFSLRNRGGWGEDGDGGHERRVRGYAYGRQLVGRCVRREGAHGVRGYAYGRQLVGRCVRRGGRMAFAAIRTKFSGRYAATCLLRYAI